MVCNDNCIRIFIVVINFVGKLMLILYKLCFNWNEIKDFLINNLLKMFGNVLKKDLICVKV